MRDYNQREIRHLIRFFEACRAGSHCVAYYQCGRLDEMGVVHPYFSMNNIHMNSGDEQNLLNNEILRLTALLPGGTHV